jgi:hypothetical protein
MAAGTDDYVLEDTGSSDINRLLARTSGLSRDSIPQYLIFILLS